MDTNTLIEMLPFATGHKELTLTQYQCETQSFIIKYDYFFDRFALQSKTNPSKQVDGLSLTDAVDVLYILGEN